MNNEMKSSFANVSSNSNNTRRSQKSNAGSSETIQQAINKESTGTIENSLPDSRSTSLINGTEDIRTTSIDTSGEETIGAIFNDYDDPIFTASTSTSSSTKNKCHFKTGASSSKSCMNEFQGHNGNLGQEDVSKLLKLITKPNIMKSPWDKRNGLKTPLKTYGNPRKSLKQSPIIESFGLPDTSIIPDKHLQPSILDANVLDASEITIEGIEFGNDSWCVDLSEDLSNLSEIRVKAVPQNHIQDKQSSTSFENASNTDFNTSPPKVQSPQIVNVKSKFNGTIANPKTYNSKFLIKNDVKITPNNSDLIKRNSLTIDEDEVEFFRSSGTSTPNSTTIKTNRLDKRVQKKEESHFSMTKRKTRSYFDKPLSYDINHKITTSDEEKTSDVIKDNDIVNDTNELSSCIKKPKDYSSTVLRKSRELRSLDNKYSGEKRKLRSSTTNSKSSEQSNSVNNKNCNELVVNLQADFQTAKDTQFLTHSSEDLMNKKKLETNPISDFFVNDNPKTTLTKTTSDPDIWISSKTKSDLVKYTSDSEISRNDHYLKQLKIILHPLRMNTEVQTTKQVKRRSTRLNKSLQDSNTDTLEAKEKKSGSREMILQLVNVIPIPDTEEFKAPLLENPAFLKLLQKEDFSVLDVLLNKKDKVKTNRVHELERCVSKVNSGNDNLPSTSASLDLPQTKKNVCLKPEANVQQSIEVTDANHKESECSSPNRKHPRIELREESHTEKSPTPKSPTKFLSKLKKSPEMLELKNIIQKINESEGRRCKVTTNEKLSECLKSRNYTRKSQGCTSNVTYNNNKSLDSSLKEVEVQDNAEKKDYNSQPEQPSNNHFLSPTDNLRVRTRRIIEMLADDDKKTSNNQQNSSELKHQEIKSIIPVETKDSPNINRNTVKLVEKSSIKILNKKPVKNKKSYQYADTNTENTKEMNEKEIETTKEKKDESFIQENGQEQTNTNDGVKEKESGVALEVLCATSSKKNNSLSLSETSLNAIRKTQSNLDLQNFTTDLKSTNSFEDKEQQQVVSLKNAKEIKSSQCDTLNITSNNDISLTSLHNSTITSMESAHNDLSDQNELPKILAVTDTEILVNQTEQIEKSLTRSVSKLLASNKEQKGIGNSIIDITKNLESHKTHNDFDDNLNPTQESDKLLPKRNRVKPKKGVSDKQNRGQQELGCEFIVDTNVERKSETKQNVTQKNELATASDITPIRRQGRSSKLTLQNQEVLNITENKFGSQNTSKTPSVLNASSHEEVKINRTLMSLDIQKEKVEQPSKHASHTEAISNIAEKSGFQNELCTSSAINSSPCRELEINETLKSANITPKRKVGRPSKHTSHGKNVNDTTERKSSSENILSSPALNNSPVQEPEGNETLMPLNITTKRKVEDHIEDVTNKAEKSAAQDILILSSAVNNSPCQETEMNKILMSPDMTPKRNVDRPNKHTPHREDVTNIADESAAQDVLILSSALNKSPYQEPEINEILMSPDITPKRKVGRPSKNTSHKKVVANITDNQSGSQNISTISLNLNNTLCQQVEINEIKVDSPSKHTSHERDVMNITESESGSLNSVINELPSEPVEDDKTLSPDVTPKRKVGRSSKHASHKQDDINIIGSEYGCGSALQASSILNTSQLQDLERNSSSDTRDSVVTDESPNETLSAKNTTDSCDLLSPLTASKRRRGRPKKNTPAKEDNADVKNQEILEEQSPLNNSSSVKNGQMKINEGDNVIIKKRVGKPRQILLENEFKESNNVVKYPNQSLDGDIEYKILDSSLNTKSSRNQVSKDTEIIDNAMIKLNGHIKPPLKIKNNSKYGLENIHETNYISKENLNSTFENSIDTSSKGDNQIDVITQNDSSLIANRNEMLNQSENLLDEEVSIINKLVSTTQSPLIQHNKESKQAKTGLSKLLGNTEFEYTGRLRNVESSNKPSRSNDKKLPPSSPKKCNNRRNSNFHEETEETIPSPRRRSKSCLLRRISNSDNEEIICRRETRSKTSLGDKILSKTDDENESDGFEYESERDESEQNNISRRTRSKTSLGDIMTSENSFQHTKLRSKSSLGEARNFVDHNVSVSPRRRTRRSSSVNQSLDEKQSRGNNDVRTQKLRSKGNNDVNDADASVKLNDSSKENSIDGGKREINTRRKHVSPKNKSNIEAFLSSKSSTKRRSIQPLKPPQQSVRRHSLGSKHEIVKRFKEKCKQEHKPFLPQLGELVWAQFSNYPYWPSFVSKEPATGLYTKITNMGSHERTVYHVNFFGDKGRRAWITNKKLLAYKNKDDLEKLYNSFQEFKAFAEVKVYFVRPNLTKTWTAAVDELEYVKAKGFNFKQITKFLELNNISSDEESLIESEDIKPEITFNSEENSGKQLNKEKNDQDEILHAQKKIKLEIGSPQTNKQKLPKKKFIKYSSEFSSEASYQLTVPKKEDPNDDDEVNKDQNIEEKMNAATQRHFGSYSIEEQKALYKRNNLFRGIPKDKVCHYCFESGDLLKCRGGCNGLYHRYCATQVLVEKYPKRRKFRTSPIKTDATVKTENLKSEPVRPVVVTSPAVVENPEIPPAKSSSEVDETHVQIVTVPSFRYESPPKKTFPPDFANMTLSERIDFKMKEIMGKFESTTYADILSESSSDEKSIASPKTPLHDVHKNPLAANACINHRTDEPLTSIQQNCNLQSLTKEPINELNISANRDLDYTKDSKLTNKYKAQIKHVTADCSPAPHNKDSPRVNGYRNPFAKHVTADSELVIDSKTFRCGFCVEDIDPYCFICNETVSKKGVLMRQKCSLHPCARFYHTDCLKQWPQTQWSLIQTTKNRFSQEEQDSFVCPQHVCHTCASDDPRAAISRCPWDKIVKCLCCPASYHSTNFCIPAGTVIISTTQIVCPRHRYKTKPYTINTTWCLLCNEGGNLICCETCPTSVHPECMTVNLTDDDRFICEDCESGRLPLYDEVVWVKLGNYKWWPSLIIFPNEIPPKVQSTKHHPGEFVVKFFGTYDYYWMNRGRAFLFQEGDTIESGINTKKKFQAAFTRAVEEAVVAHKMKKQFKILQAAESAISMKPPPYIKIKVSKPVGNVKLTELDLSNTTACECDPNQLNPCGPDSNCLNRLLLTECHPDVCPAGKHCKNQSFEKREYPTLVPYRTETRGWGLKTLEQIKKGQFVIEYVGELIDDEEYQRRIQKMHEQKEENYYFLTIYKDRMIDAGPKGNIARFMNHCCQPNCETQKWTVNGNTRVGLFATVDIPTDTELTFNYNLECTGTDKKVCKCGAPNCSGFIGVKAKNDSTELRKPKKEKKKKEPEKPMELPPCYICQRKGRVSLCNNKICNKAYHLRCLKLNERPDNKKFVCPWHYCNVCSKRTIRCCVKCLNSFCPSHSEGNVRYDNLMGFVCHTHDPTNARLQTGNVTVRKRRSHNVTDETHVSSTTTDNDEIDVEADSLRYRKSRKSKKTVEDDNIDFNISESCTSSPVKGIDDDSQDETVSSATVSDFEEEIRPKRKKKQTKRLHSKKIKLKLFNRKTMNRKKLTANIVNDSTESNMEMEM